MTLARLAVTLARPALAARHAVPLGRVGVEAVANRAVHKLAESGELGRYASLANGPGFARAIASVITGLPTLLLDVPLTTASDLSLVRALCSRTSESLVTALASDAITLRYVPIRSRIH